MYQSSSPQERERWIQEETDIPNLNLKHFSVDGIDSIKSTTSLKAEFDLPKYASVSGKRIFLTPNLTERRKYIPPDVAIKTRPLIRLASVNALLTAKIPPIDWAIRIDSELIFSYNIEYFVFELL